MPEAVSQERQPPRNLQTLNSSLESKFWSESGSPDLLGASLDLVEVLDHYREKYGQDLAENPAPNPYVGEQSSPLNFVGDSPDASEKGRLLASKTLAGENFQIVHEIDLLRVPASRVNTAAVEVVSARPLIIERLRDR